MKRLFLIAMIVFCSAVGAQTDIRFVNYGPKASLSEGDDNHVQVINIQLPQNYEGHAYLRLYDMSCGSSEDICIGSWNSRFRFSAYKGEINEDDLLKTPGYRAEINKSILGRFEIGQDARFYGKWETFVDLKKKQNDEKIYSLVVEGVEGDDGNDFKVFVSSDSIENKLIPETKIFSYEPTIAFRRNDSKIYFKVTPKKSDSEINLYTFDLDGTKSSFSSLLKNEVSVIQSSSDLWSTNKLTLTPYESASDCTFEVGPEYHDVNDVTFYITDSEGKKYSIPLGAYEKLPATIPLVEKQITYTDCNSVDLELNASSTSGQNVLSYHWQFQDGYSSTEKNISRRFDLPGKYNGEYVVIDTSSKAITRGKLEKVELIINNKPTAVAGEDIVAAPKQKNVFDGSKSHDEDGKIINYFWAFGDETTASREKVTHEYNKPGKYSVVLKAEDDYPNPSCNYSLDTLSVIINAQPNAVTQEKIIGSVNQVLKFDASASNDADGIITNYRWNLNEYGIKEGVVVEQSFPYPGIFHIKLNVRDNSTASNNEMEKTVTVIINDPPKAIAGQDKTIAENEEILFDGSKSVDKDGRIIQYDWTFGDGDKASGEKVSHHYKLAGKYCAVLKVKDDSNTDSDNGIDSLHIVVNDKPIAKIVNEIYLKDGEAKFDASESSDKIGGISKYIWNFGDGSTAEEKVLNHIYKVPGTYSVILKVVDKLNTSSNFSFDTSKVIINKKPIADIGTDRLVAVNQKIKFSSSRSVDPDGKIISTRWFVDNVFKSNEPNFEYSIPKPGNYLVGLEVTDDFKYPAKGIAYAKIKVNSSPFPSIVYTKNVSPKEKVKFDASKAKDIDGIIKEYIWNFSDGTSGNGKTIEKAFDTPGNYTATLSIKDDSNVENSISRDTVVVKVNSSPIIKVDESIETCSNIVTIDASKTIDPDGDDLIFYWEFPKQPKQKAGSVVTHNFEERGILPVTLTVDDGLGLSNSISRKTILVKVHQQPIADAGSDTTVCAGDIVILSGLKSRAFEKGLLQYEWMFDDSVKLSGSNIFRVFKKGGIYSVTLKVTDDSGLECNSSIATKIIKVLAAPIAVAGHDIVSCAFKPVSFDGSKSTSPGGVVSSYSWDFGDDETGSGANPMHIYTKPGTYKVVLTITGDIKGKCDNTSKDQLTVTVTEAPIASFAAKDSIAENSENIFNASSTSTQNGKIVGYEWNFGDGITASGSVVKHKFAKYGNYNVVLTIKTDSQSECNSSSTTKLIYINVAPVAVIATKKECIINETVVFDGSKSSDSNGKVSSYKWNFGDGGTGNGINAVHQYLHSGNYLAKLTIRDDTGTENNSASDSVMITVNSSPLVKFVLPQKVLTNDEIKLDATGSMEPDGKKITYEWFVNGSRYSTDPITKIKFEKSGQKIITLRVKGNSNVMNDVTELSQYVNVIGYPTVSIPNKLNVCKGESINVRPIINPDDEANLFSYVWTKKGSNEKYLASELNVTSVSSAVYYFEVFDKMKNRISFDSTLVVINNPPQLPVMNDTTIYIGRANDEILFDGSRITDIDGDILNIKWNFGDGKNSMDPISFHRYEKEGVYKVELEADDQQNTACSKVKTTFHITVKK